MLLLLLVVVVIIIMTCPAKSGDSVAVMLTIQKTVVPDLAEPIPNHSMQNATPQLHADFAVCEISDSQSDDYGWAAFWYLALCSLEGIHRRFRCASASNTKLTNRFTTWVMTPFRLHELHW
jgi:hypothetical protein